MILRLININEIEKFGTGYTEIQHHIITDSGVRVKLITNRTEFFRDYE